MQPQLRQDLAGVETEVAHHPTSFLRRGIVGSDSGKVGECDDKTYERNA